MFIVIESILRIDIRVLLCFIKGERYGTELILQGGPDICSRSQVWRELVCGLSVAGATGVQ